MSRDEIPAGEIRSRLASIARQTARPANSEPKSGFATSSRVRQLAEELGGTAHTSGAGEFVTIERTLDAEYTHGRATVGEYCAREFSLSHFDTRQEHQLIDPSNFLFLDTETTGLGGSGALAFMVGVARIVDGRLHTRQYVMADFCDEAGMLEAVRAEFSPATVIVSYNGRAFDMPILRDRLIVNRLVRELEHCAHIDLLYPARALFKRRLGNCSLKNIECHALGFVRVNDFPGHLAPSAFFAWSHAADADDLDKVVEHNRLDVVSLAFLTGLFSQYHTSDGETIAEALDLDSFVRWHERARNFSLAASICDRRGGELRASGDPAVALRHAQLFKKIGLHEKAMAIWSELSRRTDFVGQSARIELAKRHEYGTKDYAAALAATRAAREMTIGNPTALELLRRREERLERKIKANSAPVSL